ncbi:TlpA family protein disulfide reductase [Ottowia testudinis]|uniref:TlpA family protein disulfide reductase n=1 Tax=Ottowia testudinis TaxID=2816950 RepID=UPI001FB0DF34|nr:TlpA disulfide reductase family protein [Ottowia testudinis]
MALAAAVVGGAVGWRRFQLAEPDLAGFWGQSFPAPDGASHRLATFRGRPLLVNFWATWCPPCVEEMPLLSRFYTENKANGMQLLGLAVDKPESVQRFLARLPVSFPVALAGVDGIELARQLGNTVGGLPFSILFDANGRLLERKLGPLNERDLSGWRAAVLV